LPTTRRPSDASLSSSPNKNEDAEQQPIAQQSPPEAGSNLPAVWLNNSLSIHRQHLDRLDPSSHRQSSLESTNVSSARRAVVIANEPPVSFLLFFFFFFFVLQ
jgi:hypothetical protein